MPSLLAAVLGFADGAGLPRLPGGGGCLLGLIIIVVCAQRKKEEIGGWLLYYYIQLYIALVMTVVFTIIGIENYLPAMWAGEEGLYVLFLLSTVPGVLIVPLQLIAAERLRRGRRYERLGLLKTLLWADLFFSLIGLLIDLVYFRENVAFSVIALIWPLIWLPYFYRSKRVDRVFRTRDWLPAPEPGLVG